jgi:hypothetical protein
MIEVFEKEIKKRMCFGLTNIIVHQLITVVNALVVVWGCRLMDSLEPAREQRAGMREVRTRVLCAGKAALLFTVYTHGIGSSSA